MHGPVIWPPCTSVLTLIDFYVWSQAKQFEYAMEGENRDDLVQYIETAFITIEEKMRLRTTMVEIKQISQRGQKFEQDL